MTRLSVQYDREACLWDVLVADTRRLLQTKRIILEVPARSKGGCLVVDTDHVQGDTEEVRIGHPPPPRGELKPREMREWVALFDPNTQLWVTYRRDHDDVVVTTQDLEIDCHAITSEGRWHCLSEQLVVGRTNRLDKIQRARKVRLRRLEVYDQTVEVPVMSMRSAAQPPG